MEPWAAAKKKLKASMVMTPTLVWVLSQWPLAPNVTSVMYVANDKDDNEMIKEAVYRSPGISLIDEDSHE